MVKKTISTAVSAALVGAAGLKLPAECELARPAHTLFILDETEKMVDRWTKMKGQLEKAVTDIEKVVPGSRFSFSRVKKGAQSCIGSGTLLTKEEAVEAIQEFADYEEKWATDPKTFEEAQAEYEQADYPLRNWRWIESTVWCALTEESQLWSAHKSVMEQFDQGLVIITDDGPNTEDRFPTFGSIPQGDVFVPGQVHGPDDKFMTFMYPSEKMFNSLFTETGVVPYYIVGLGENSTLVTDWWIDALKQQKFSVDHHFSWLNPHGDGIYDAVTKSLIDLSCYDHTPTTTTETTTTTEEPTTTTTTEEPTTTTTEASTTTTEAPIKTSEAPRTDAPTAGPSTTDVESSTTTKKKPICRHPRRKE